MDKEQQVAAPILLLPKPPAPPPLIERLKNEATEISQVPGSQIFYYFGQSHLIGRGASSMVFRGYHQTPEKKAAVKLVTHNEIDTNELEVWNKLRSSDHPSSKYVVTLYECAIVDNVLYICMEMADCNLAEEISYKRLLFHNKFLQISSYLKNITAGLQHLHSNNIVHRDIKPQNIFIFENAITGERTAKLGDFGLSRLLSQSDGSISFGKGTLIWMSPEALRSLDEEEEFVNTKAMDIFSLGLVYFYTITYKAHPFEENEKLLVNIKDEFNKPKSHSIQQDDKCASAEHLILWMLEKDPRRRPTISQCRAHPFLWEKEEEKYLKFICEISRVINVEVSSKDDQIIYAVGYAVNGHYQQRMKNARTTHKRGNPWNWQHELDPILQAKYPNTQVAGYNGYSGLSFLEFVNFKADNPGTLREDAVEMLFSEEGEGSSGKFCRKRFARYFIELYPEMLVMFFFAFARIAPHCSALKEMEEKYFKEFVGCHDYWSHGVVSRCLERLYKKLERDKISLQ